MVRIVGFLALVLAFSSVPAVAQQQPAQPQSTADAIAEGSLQGRAAAEGIGTGGYLAGGLLSGVTLGLIGTGITYAVAANSGVEVPASEMMMARERGAAYTQAYQEAFRDRVKDKRKSSALIGGLSGTAILLVLVASAGA